MFQFRKCTDKSSLKYGCGDLAVSLMRFEVSGQSLGGAGVTQLVSAWPPSELEVPGSILRDSSAGLLRLSSDPCSFNFKYP